MKPIMRILASRLLRFSVLSILSSTSLFSQPSISNQIITLEVLELNKIFVTKDRLALEPVAVAWTGLEGVVVSGQTRLIWTSNGDTRKISIASKQASESCVVRIELNSASGFVPVGKWLELADSTTHDFIRGIERSAGRCDLRFLVFTNDPRGAQNHPHAIVYTVTTS